MRVSALRRQARAAERYRALTDKIRLAEGKLIYARWADADRAALDTGTHVLGTENLAEREGLEPPVRITVQQISSLPHSTTLPPLRW